MIVIEIRRELFFIIDFNSKFRNNFKVFRKALSKVKII